MGLPARLIWGFLTVLTGLALWLHGSGQVYLYGLPDEVLEALAQGAGLVPASTPAGVTDLLARLPFDPILSASLFSSGSLVLSFIIVWATFRRIWANAVSAALAGSLLFFGLGTLWLTAATPTDCLAVAFQALGVGCLVAGKVPLLLGSVLGAAYCDPAAGVSLYLALAYLAFKRQEAYGVPVSVASVLGGGALLALFCTGYTLVPSLSGLGVWSLLPLLGIAKSSELRASRGGLYLTLLGASVLTGSPELASSVALGDLAFMALRGSTPQADSDSPPGPGRLPLVHGAALLVWTLAVLPGGQSVQQRILLPAADREIALSTLLIPFSLETHAQNLERDSWRVHTPFPGMKAREVELLQSVQGPFRVLSLNDKPSEDRKLAVIYSLLSGQPLSGWDDPSQLSASSLICKALGSNVLVGGEAVLFRNGDSCELQTSPSLPTELSALPRVDFRRVLNVPFRVQKVSENPGTGYHLSTGKKTETLFFADQPAVVAFSAAPRQYLLTSLSDPTLKQEIEISRLRLELVRSEPEESLTSGRRSPINFMLYNRGFSPISAAEVESLTLTLSGVSTVKPAEQPLAKSFILYPEEGISLELFLAAPEQEGDYQLEASFKTLEGREREMLIGGPATITTRQPSSL